MRYLLESEIWRDGGSLSAIVSDQGQDQSFWLQTNSWMSDQSEREYLSLYVSRGSQPDAKEEEVAQNSAEEAHWLKYLNEVSLDKADENSKIRFSQLIKILSARQ